MLDSRVLIEGAYSADDRPQVRALVRRLIRLPPLIVVLLLSFGLWAAIWGSSRLWLRLCRDSQFTRSAVPIARTCCTKDKKAQPLWCPYLTRNERFIPSLRTHGTRPASVSLIEKPAKSIATSW